MPEVEPTINKEILAPDQEKDEEKEKEQEKLMKESPFFDNQEPDEKDEEKVEDKEVEDKETEEVNEEEKVTEEKSTENQKTTEQSVEEKDSGQLIAENKSLREKVASLESEVSSYKTQLQSVAQLKNLLEETGLSQEDVNKQAFTLKQMKKVAEDLVSVPQLGEALKKFYSGELAEVEEKVPQDFMPEGEVFDQAEAFIPNTYSNKAFVEWQKHIALSEQKKNEFLASIEQERKSSESIGKGFIEQVKKLVTGFDAVKAELSNRFPISEETWEGFKKFYASGDNEIIKAAFSVYAGKNGIKDKVVSKLEQNKQKANAIITSKTKKTVDTGRKTIAGVPIEYDEKQKELWSELLGEEF